MHFHFRYYMLLTGLSCLLLLPALISAQTVKDSILLLINTATTDSARAHHCNTMATVLFYENVDSALHYANRARRIAEGALILSEQAQAHYASAVLYNTRGQRHEQHFHLDEALRLARQIQDTSILHAVMVEQGLLLIDDSRMAEALKRLQQSLLFANDNKESLLYSLYYIASLHLEMGNDSLSMVYEQRAFSVLEELDETLLRMQLLIQTGRSYIQAEQWAQAENRLSQGLKLAEQQQSQNSIALALQGLAKIKIHEKQYEAAGQYLKKAMALSLKNNYKTLQLIVILTRMDLFIKTRQYEEALRFYQSNYPTVAPFRHSTEQRLNLWSMLNTIYSNTNRYDAAYRAQDSVMAYQSSLLKDQQQKAVAALESEYQLQQEEAERDALAIETQEQRLKISERRTLLFILLAVLILLLISVFAVFFANKMTRAYQQKLQTSIDQSTAQLRNVNQQLRTARLRLETFFRTTATQLNAPLQQIKQELPDVAPDETLNNKQPLDYYKYMEKGIHQMETLIGGIQAFASAHNTTLSYKTTNLQALTEQIQKETALDFPDKTVRLEYLNAMPVIAIPREIVDSILRQLIANAIHFTPEKQVTVKVGYHRTSQQHEIQITDYGTGIPSEFQERIFDLFYRLQDREQSKNPGVGLALSQKLAQQMNGALRVKSAPGMGSTFTLSVPVQ